MGDLHGTYTRKLTRGRVRVPVDWRRSLPELVIVFEAIAGDCLWLMSFDDFNAWLDKVFDDQFGGYKPNDSQHVMLRRMIAARCYDCGIGSSGSIGIPAELREKLALRDEVVLVGCVDHVELWDANTWHTAAKSHR